jgi:hypothetical protein
MDSQPFKPNPKFPHTQELGPHKNRFPRREMGDFSGFSLLGEGSACWWKTYSDDIGGAGRAGGPGGAKNCNYVCGWHTFHSYIVIDVSTHHSWPTTTTLIWSPSCFRSRRFCEVLSLPLHLYFPAGLIDLDWLGLPSFQTLLCRLTKKSSGDSTPLISGVCHRHV